MEVVYILSMDDDILNTNEERKPWDQMEGEPSLWYGRFRSFLEMGFKRNVNALYKKEVLKNPGKLYPLVDNEWYKVCREWNWKERAKAYDANWIEEQDKIIAQEKEIVLRSGYALMHNRIRLLNKFVEKMEQWADDDSKAWVLKTQTVTGDGFSKHTEEETFNAPMFTMIDKYLDSIAKEKGERVKKNEVAITELPPNVYLGFNPDDDGSVTQEKDEEKE
jgi:hypothetical protein